MPRPSSGKSPRAKRPANLSINNELLEKARRLEINLSQALEERLLELICEKERQNWLTENRTAIEAYNERIEREGVFSDGLRTF